MNIEERLQEIRSNRKKLDKKRSQIGARRRSIALLVEALEITYSSATGPLDKALLLDWFMAQLKTLDPK